MKSNRFLRKFALINLVVASLSLGFISSASATSVAPHGDVAFNLSIVSSDAYDAEWEDAMRTALAANGASEADQDRILSMPREVIPEPATTKGDAAPSIMAVDRCSYSPDSWFAANFTASCASHDYCYSGFSTTNRLQCDTWFLSNLIGDCYEAYGRNGGFNADTCVNVTGGYYAAVRQFGGQYYEGRGLNN